MQYDFGSYSLAQHERNPWILPIAKAVGFKCKLRVKNCQAWMFLACHPRKVAHTVDAREEHEKGDDEMVEELFFSFNRRTEGGTEGCDVASP